MNTHRTPPDSSEWDRLAPVLDQELQHLPDKYRQPIVLCYLEGRTNEEAAQLLGWPSGSMSRRLSKGRDLLRRRLVRRGAGLSGTALAAVLVQNTSAAVPAVTVSSLTEAALLVAAAQTVATAGASAGAVELSKGVVKMIMWTKIQTVTLSVIAVSVLAGGVSLAVKPTPPEQPGAPAPASERPPAEPAIMEVGDLTIVVDVPNRLPDTDNIPATVSFRNTGKERFALNPIGHGFTFTDKKSGRSYRAARVTTEGQDETVAYSQKALDAAESDPTVVGHSIQTDMRTKSKTLTLKRAIVLDPGASKAIKLTVEQFGQILPARPGTNVSRKAIESIPTGTYDIQYQFRSVKPGAKKAQALKWWATTLSLIVRRELG